MSNKNQSSLLKNQFNLFDLLILFIVCVSLVSILLLSLNQFNPLISLLISILISTIFYSQNKFLLTFQLKKIAPFSLIIFLIIILRLKPYNWIFGGQDQGLYINMAAHYRNYGSNFIKDKVRSVLTEQEKQIYDLEAHFAPAKNFHNLSILINDLNNSQYYFEFYPLHPIWMANFSYVLGKHFAPLSITVFSILSILVAYKLVLLITNNYKSAKIASLFLAVNPLHAFFSKFPTTEILTSFLSLSFFYYFIKYFQSLKKPKTNIFALLISSFLYLCLYLNHISTVFYLPLLIILFVFINPHIRKKMTPFFLIIILNTVLANLYYFFNARTLLATYDSLIKKLINYNSSYLNLFIGLILILIFLIYSYKTFLLKLTNRIYHKPYFFLYIFLLILGFILIRVNNLTTNSIENMPYSGNGWESLNFSSFLVFIRYLSPIGFLLLFPALGKIEVKNKSQTFLYIYFLYFLFVRLFFQFSTPYQYYYARYLLPELVVYGILIISVYLGKLFDSKNSKQINFASLARVTIFLYFVYFSLFQLKGSELQKTKRGLDQIAQHVKKEDLLINGIYFFKEKIDVALDNYYDLSLIPSGDYIATLKKYNYSIQNTFHQIYVLSPVKLKDPNLILKEDISLFLDQFEWTNKIPTKFQVNKANIFLYQVIDKNYSYESKVN